MTGRRVLLLRHGRTTWNAQRRFQGQADPPLDDIGRAQAHEVAAILAALRPTLLVTSDLARAVQTAQIVGDACGLPTICEPRIRERGLGHWEGLTREEVAAEFPDEFADWIAGRDVSRRGGETREQVAERSAAAFADLDDVAMTVLVTHSATAMALTKHLLGIPQTAQPLGPLANCHWSDLRVESDDGGAPLWMLRGHNLGSPGTIVPLPVRAEDDEATDADA